MFQIGRELASPHIAQYKAGTISRYVLADVENARGLSLCAVLRI